MKAILPALPLLLLASCISAPKPERSDEEIMAEVMKRVDAALEEQRREMMDEIREIVAKKVVVERGTSRRDLPPQSTVPAPVPAKPEPNARARRPVPQGKTPGFLGIRPSDTDAGVRIDGVIPGSAAERLQLKEGDVLTHVNGRPVKTVGQLTEMITAMGAGATVELKLLRNGNEVSASTTLGSRPVMEQDSAPGDGDLEKTVERAMREIEKQFEKKKAEEEK